MFADVKKLGILKDKAFVVKWVVCEEEPKINIRSSYPMIFSILIYCL